MANVSEYERFEIMQQRAMKRNETKFMHNSLHFISHGYIKKVVLNNTVRGPYAFHNQKAGSGLN